MTRLAVPSATRTAILGLLLPFSVGALGWSQTPVDIYYDADMVPHIFGDDDEAAMYGLGWHHMMEFPIGTLNSLWHTSGRSAEVWGESYLDEDRVIHLWDVPAIADRHAMDMSADHLAMITAYVEGVEAGRAWWREGGDPADSERIDTLLNPDGNASLDIAVDPAPDYLNQTFSPYAATGYEPLNPFVTWFDAGVPTAIRSAVDRMFDASMVITEEHVHRLGVAVNSFFLLRNNKSPVNVLKNRSEEGESINSNGWMISPNHKGGPVVTLSDGHVGFNRLAVRPYFVQVQGDTYHATGITIPGYPGCYVGFNDWVSWMVTGRGCATVWRNRWEATLETTAPLRFSYTHSGGTDTITLEEVSQDLVCFDPTTEAVTTETFTHHYVPKHSSEPLSLVFDRYALITDDAPLPGDTIVFEQAAFAGEGSPWAFLFSMGQAHDADTDVDAAFAEGQVLFGGGLNFQVADRDSNFRYEFMARIPEQGPGVAVEDYKTKALLDGSTHMERWQGYDAVPSIGPADTSTAQEAWIINNATPDKVETIRFDETDLGMFPHYVCTQGDGTQSSTTWRQERADDVLRGLIPALTQPISEATALDKTDNWMLRHWPLYQILRGDVDHDGVREMTETPFSVLSAHPAFLTRIDPFIDWIEFYRDYDETDTANVLYDFVAHRQSQVTVYTTLLRSTYLNKLLQETTVNSLQETLGHDPIHVVLDDFDTLFTEGAYGPNAAAMVKALAVVSKLWKKGTTRLVNQPFLLGLDSSTWGGTYDTLQEAPWDSVILGTKITRWGHVNTLVETAHSLPDPRKRFGGKAGFVTLGITTKDIIEGMVYLDLTPPMLVMTPFLFLNMVPFYVEQPGRRVPIGGARTSLFTANHSRMFVDPAPSGYDQSVYVWDGGFLYYHPLTGGSQTMLSVQLHPIFPASARCLAALGATEITEDVTVVTGGGDDIDLSYQDRYGNLDDFADELWHDLITDESMLGSPTHSLTYTAPPAPVRR